MERNIQMVDLRGQYEKIKPQIDRAMQSVIDGSAFINGPQVTELQTKLSEYLGIKHTITCGNGTDALQLAIMSLNLQPGDEIITPSFTFIATAEAIAICGLVPVLVDVDPATFTIDPAKLHDAISTKTRAVISVNLFGQAADYCTIVPIIEKHNLTLIEDNAQAFGAEYTLQEPRKLGTVGFIGCTSFFPSKNLGCFGDGGAVFTNDDGAAERLRLLANHGAKQKYHHQEIGINSRLDTLQAAILLEKLQHIDEYNSARRQVAQWYNSRLESIEGIETPKCQEHSTHVYHQYTIRLTGKNNADIQAKLKEKHIPSMIYYPVSLHKQKAFEQFRRNGNFSACEQLESQVLSLPMHTELTEKVVDYICSHLIKHITSN